MAIDPVVLSQCGESLRKAHERQRYGLSDHASRNAQAEAAILKYLELVPQPGPITAEIVAEAMSGGGMLGGWMTMLKPKDVVRLRSAANQLSQFSSDSEYVYLADHVAAELKHYDHDGKPLPVDREWLLEIGGKEERACRINGDRFSFTDDGLTLMVSVGYVAIEDDAGEFVVIIGENAVTRPRLLALLAGLGIQHKDIA